MGIKLNNNKTKKKDSHKQTRPASDESEHNRGEQKRGKLKE